MDLSSLLLMLLASATVLVSLTAMGIMIALLALLWRQVSSIASVLGILFEMLAGAYLHLSAFPAGVRVFSYLLPFTWGYDLLRYYSFRPQDAAGAWQTILPVWQEWGGWSCLPWVLQPSRVTCSGGQRGWPSSRG